MIFLFQTNKIDKDNFPLINFLKKGNLYKYKNQVKKIVNLNEEKELKVVV